MRLFFVDNKMRWSRPAGSSNNNFQKLKPWYITHNQECFLFCQNQRKTPFPIRPEYSGPPLEVAYFDTEAGGSKRSCSCAESETHPLSLSPHTPGRSAANPLVLQAIAVGVVGTKFILRSVARRFQLLYVSVEGKK